MITPKLTSKSQGTTQYVDVVNGELQMSRAVYQLIGSLVKNRHILDDYEGAALDVTYVNFLDRMAVLFDYNKLNPLGIDTPIPDQEIVDIDEYLGDLGILQEYKYGKDRIDVAAWVDMETPTSIRVLVDSDDEVYLIDTSDNTVLVRYK